MTKDLISNFHCELYIYMYICRNIPAAPAYGVYIFQLIHYSWSRACGSYHAYILYLDR